MATTTIFVCFLFYKANQKPSATKLRDVWIETPVCKGLKISQATRQAVGLCLAQDSNHFLFQYNVNICILHCKFIHYILDLCYYFLLAKVLHLEPGNIGFDSFTPEEYLEEMLGRFMSARTKGGAKEDF